MKLLYTHKISPRWSDFDQFGHVNNATYLTYFEDARLYYFKSICAWDFKKTGVVIAKASIDYLLPIMFGTVPVVDLYCSRMGNKSFDFHYEVSDESDSNKKYTTGLTTIVTLDPVQEHPIPVPDEYRKKLQP